MDSRPHRQYNPSTSRGASGHVAKVSPISLAHLRTMPLLPPIKARIGLCNMGRSETVARPLQQSSVTDAHKALEHCQHLNDQWSGPM